MTTLTTTPKSTEVIAAHTVPGTKVRIMISRCRMTWATQPFYIVDEYNDLLSTWSKPFKTEQDARDAANKRWTLAYSKTPAYRQGLKNQTRPDVTDGFWEIHGTVYKVQRSQTSGNLYGKRLDVDPDGTRSWTYTPGAVADIRRYGSRVTAETAKQYGELYGQCILCGRTLTREESIERSMGPICFGKLG